MRSITKKNSKDRAGIEQIKWSLYQRHVCFCNPCAHTESHQQECGWKLCSAILTVGLLSSNLEWFTWFQHFRRSGLMVGALNSRASSPGSSPGRGHCAMFLGKTLLITLTVPLSTQVGTGKLLGKPNKLRGSDLCWTSIPSRGSRNTSNRFMLQKPG